MMRSHIRLLFYCVLITASSCMTSRMPATFGPVPSDRQLKWHQLKYYAFIHFGPNTFTDIEWGHGDESPDVFHPTALDADQWARVIRDAGMEGVIITAKHHDGFCLWPSKYSTHTVRESKWRDGKGDVLRDLADACAKHQLKLGVYLSPWDRNHPAYGTDSYNDVFKDMLEEVLTSYGPIYEVWFDGANGEGPNGKKQVYDFPGFAEVVRKHQPDAVIFSDAGPDIRWVGNERGYAGSVNWSTVREGAFYPGIPGVNDQLQAGHEDGDIWLPTEVNTSIRPGWFYHKEEDDDVKSVNQLIDNWYHSVGMNGNFLLNLPVDTRGLVHENDIKALQGLKAYIDEAFSKNLASPTSASTGTIYSDKFPPEHMVDEDLQTFWASSNSSDVVEIDLGSEMEINTVLLQEYITLGQRVRSFTIEVFKDGQFEVVFEGNTIGNRRLAKFPKVVTQKIKITLDGKAPPVINNLEVFRVPERLSSPELSREAGGMVSIHVDSPDPVIYYTLDGSEPDTSDFLYEGPFVFDQKGTVKARAYIENYRQSSDVVTRAFDIPKHNWNIRSTCGNDDYLRRLIDGEEGTIWRSNENHAELPCDVILDLGQVVMLETLSLLPRQDHREGGHLNRVAVALSQDGVNWKQEILDFEFANILNNPVIQNIQLRQPVSCRYIKIQLTEDLAGLNWATLAEIDVITN